MPADHSKEIASVLNLTFRTVAFHKYRAAGYSNQEIAEWRKISKDTVKHHLGNIFDKFGVSTPLGLAVTPAPPKLTTVVVSPSEKSIAVNAVVTFIAMALDQNGIVIQGPVSFTWTSSTGGVVTPNSIQDDAPTGFSQVQFTGAGANQSTVITATATFNGKSAGGGGAITEVF